jgi:hypothetical protein
MMLKLPPYQISINLRVCKILWHTDLLLGNDHKTNEKTAVARQQPMYNNGGTVGGGVFYVVHSAAILRDWASSVNSCSAGKWRVGWWVSELVRELQFSHCGLLLLEAGSWGMGIVWEPRVRGMSAVRSCYQATTGEDTADWEGLVHAVVNCRMNELAMVL